MTASTASLLSRLNKAGHERLSESFFLRDFLHSEVAIAYGLANVPDDLNLAVDVGTQLCCELLEPMQARFGRLHIRSAFRSSQVNAICNQNGHGCARNDLNYADHIWDRRDAAGRKGATACIVVPAFADRFAAPGDWTELAWWIHEHLPYHSLYFFPKRWAVNIQWREMPERRIDSYAKWHDGEMWRAKGTLTKGGMANHETTDESRYHRLTKAFEQ